MNLTRRAARFLGLSGMLLSALLIAGVWTAGLLALAPAQAALDTAQTQLQALDHQLVSLQGTVTPLDSLLRPEAQAAVQTLSELTQAAQRTPIVGTVFGADNLQQAADLTTRWQAALAQPLPALDTLSSTRAQVQGWQSRLTTLEQSLRLGVYGLCLLLTFLGGWSFAGQWALYRLASMPKSLAVRDGAKGNL